ALTYIDLSLAIATTVCPCVSGLSTVLVACGSCTLTPCWSSGATIIMMISSTSMTSQSGVTLMSDLTPPLAPPRSIAITVTPVFRNADYGVGIGFSSAIRTPQSAMSRFLGGLPHEVVDELRRRVVHLDVEVLDAAGEVIVEPHCRNRDHQSEGGLDQ